MRVVGPAIEASKFFVEEEQCREMFSQLIASACDSVDQNYVHPAFPEIIKQPSAMGAVFLTHFKQIPTLPCVEIFACHKDQKVTPFPFVLFDFKGSTPTHSQCDELELSKTVENLVSLGLLIKNDHVLEFNYDYDSFRSHWLYKSILPTIEDGSTLDYRKFRVELTSLGTDFVKTCL